MTTAEPVPPARFDFSNGPIRRGNVIYHPPIPVHTSPALLITFHPAAETSVANVGAEVRPLFDRLAAHWQALGGGDLKSEVSAGRRGAIYWVVSAERADEANDRMRQLGDLLTGAEPPVEVGEWWRPLQEKYRPAVVVQKGC